MWIIDSWHKPPVAGHQQATGYRRLYFNRLTVRGPELAVWLLLIFMASCQRADQLNQNGAGDSIIHRRRHTLPNDILFYIHGQLPGSALVDTAEYAVSWWSFYDRDEIPYQAIADFNDDGLADYALLLKNGDKINLVIISMQGNKLSHWVAPGPVANGTANLHVGLSVEPPGRIDIVRPAIRSLILRSNAVNLYDFENRVRIYYSKNGSFEVFDTH
ncbi:hypothetical protein [Hufsiella ginkgonis]|uniref:Uncharacterized protein n=1 Tax=Hufsiella ginkgonis TaxID=2695274 RepID=A0A7K1Y013_9SPHI|nr:hypothetical protein [Hufsiella ginkgonis]MXV16407.1 hypothetical protein [Hufsiella ginkgonis]